MDATAHTLQEYEGLIRSTASRYVGVMAGAAMDFDDLTQYFRVKVWKALEAYDEERWADRDKWVFMCVRNAAKDLVKRRQERIHKGGPSAQDPLHIEDIAPAQPNNPSYGWSGNGNGDGPRTRDRFEMRYLSEDDVFASRDEPPRLPDTLTLNERRVLVLLYNGYRPVDIAPMTGLTNGQVRGAITRLREKLADLRPVAA